MDVEREREKIDRQIENEIENKSRQTVEKRRKGW